MKSRVPFENATYRSQVSRLRSLATQVLKLYPIRVRKLEFIRHAENATFCVHSTLGRRYLLRIHRGGYHTEAAILEELRWLAHLKKHGVVVPAPLRSNVGRVVETLATDGVPKARQCCVFEWVDGKFVGNNITLQNTFELGSLLAKLQQTTPAPKSRHRLYWTADGLVGDAPKFGPVKNLKGVDRRPLAVINRARPKVLSALRRYQRAHPEKMGLIHADLHFGNILRTKSGLAPIDFDDSGYGFYGYDLAISLMAVQGLLGKKRKREFPKFRQALIDGYSKFADFNGADEKMLIHFSAARRIAMLGWLNSRSDNPRLRAHLKKSAKAVALFLKKSYG